MIDAYILIVIVALIVGFRMGYGSGWLRGQHDMLNVIENEMEKERQRRLRKETEK